MPIHTSVGAEVMIGTICIIISTTINHILLEMRTIDLKEKDLIDRFLTNGCDCKKGVPCHTLFTREYYETVRAQCQELDRSALDMVIMGYLLGSLNASTEVQRSSSHRVPKERERQRLIYYHRGQKV